jgi:uncharacterized membrane protein YtjA (UPF0391 family)
MVDTRLAIRLRNGTAPLDHRSQDNETILECNMLSWAIFFLIAALIAALFGFAGIATAFAGIAKILFFVFLVVFAAVLVAHFFGGARRALR